MSVKRKKAHRSKRKKARKLSKVKRRAAPIIGYHEQRERDQLEVHRREIDAFITAYKKAPPSSGRQTLFFFPGGMACQLWRSTRRFKDGVANKPFKYDKMWLRLSSLLWRARKLGMTRESASLFRDKDNYIVIADGAVNFKGCTPHDGLIKWCKDNSVDLFVFNWDWRRRQEDVVRFFVKRFWPLFKDRVKEAGIPALRRFSLLGHSFGGMIVNLILRGQDGDVAAKLHRAITAATPFYGYAGQVHRWFEGETLLNGDGKGEWTEIVEVINSMPGLYVLHYLDYDYTFQRDGKALAGDPEFPLSAYPNTDAATGASFDPWGQDTDAKGDVRYPEQTMGFQSGELTYARDVYRRMADPLSDPRFYNIRGVQTDANDKPLSNTVGSARCDWITPKFDPPQNKCPITNGGRVPGDGTQPAWTTRLVSNGPGRCKDVRNKDVRHMFLMSNAGTLRALADILLSPPGSATIAPPPLPRAASASDYREFVDWIGKYGKRRSIIRPSDQQIWDDMPAAIREKFSLIAPRIIEDILKRPDGMHE